MQAGPYAAEIESARQLATSDFERAVLSDGAITRQEYEEAIQRYVSCAKSQGLTISLIDAGGYYRYSMRTSADNEAIEARCNAGTIMVIGGLYEQLVKNPSNQDIVDLEFSCLQSKGVVAAGYTVDEYRHEMGLDGEAPTASGPSFDTSNPWYVACADNPADPQL